MCRNGKEAIYDLFGVISERHDPEVHYSCVLQHCGKYFVFDDEIVSEVKSLHDGVENP